MYWFIAYHIWKTIFLREQSVWNKVTYVCIEILDYKKSKQCKSSKDFFKMHMHMLCWLLDMRFYSANTVGKKTLCLVWSFTSALFWHCLEYALKLKTWNSVKMWSVRFTIWGHPFFHCQILQHEAIEKHPWELILITDMINVLKFSLL